MEGREILKSSKGMSLKPKRRSRRRITDFPLRRSPRLLLGGASSSNSESLSSSSLGRRSSNSQSQSQSHLLAKSAMPQIAPPPKPTQCSQRSPEKPAHTSPLKPSEHVGKGSSARSVYKSNQYPDYEYLKRLQRSSDAYMFKISYQYCASMEKRTLICSGNTSSDLVKSHGITWVAVHGMKSICVVFRNEAVDESRLRHMLGRESVLQYFGRFIISEMEDLADSSSKLSPQLSDPIRNGRPGSPFAVVSVIQGANNVHEGSSHEQTLDAVLDEFMVVQFLLNETNRDSAFTSSETMKQFLHSSFYSTRS